MKKFFLLLIICICSFCSRSGHNPKDLYPKEQVAIFLKDLYLLETKVKDLRVRNDSARIIFNHYEAKLFEKHGMDSALYRASFRHYMDDVNGMTKIYEIIADSLSLEERIMLSGYNEEY